jgi:hypothetical protein
LVLERTENHLENIEIVNGEVEKHIVPLSNVIRITTHAGDAAVNRLADNSGIDDLLQFSNRRVLSLYVTYSEQYLSVIRKSRKLLTLFHRATNGLLDEDRLFEKDRFLHHFEVGLGRGRHNKRIKIDPKQLLQSGEREHSFWYQGTSCGIQDERVNNGNHVHKGMFHHHSKVISAHSPKAYKNDPAALAHTRFLKDKKVAGELAGIKATHRVGSLAASRLQWNAVCLTFAPLIRGLK